ncbi:MAG: zinc ribbon domain-containing protein [Defluviitaleaceae bacterium]|nr:zinc ribbon domain-containing protein [Defluviitaleaceae bacterium]
MSDSKTGTAANVIKAVTEGSGRLLKTTKLSINLSNEEGKLKAIYNDIGKAVHEIYKHGGTLGAMFDDKYKMIVEQEAKIADIRNRLEIAKGVVICPKCDTNSKRGSSFCQRCGESLSGAEEYVVVSEATATDHRLPLQEPQQQQIPSQPTGKICNVCSATNDPFERFCLSCGRAL